MADLDLLGFVIFMAVVGGVYFKRRWRQFQKSGWHTYLDSHDGWTEVGVTRHGRKIVIGSVRIQADTYADLLAEEEAKAFEKCAILNSTERTNKRKVRSITS